MNMRKNPREIDCIKWVKCCVAQHMEDKKRNEKGRWRVQINKNLQRIGISRKETETRRGRKASRGDFALIIRDITKQKQWAKVEGSRYYKYNG